MTLHLPTHHHAGAVNASSVRAMEALSSNPNTDHQPYVNAEPPPQEHVFLMLITCLMELCSVCTCTVHRPYRWIVRLCSNPLHLTSIVVCHISVSLRAAVVDYKRMVRQSCTLGLMLQLFIVLLPFQNICSYTCVCLIKVVYISIFGVCCERCGRGITPLYA